MNDSSRSPVKPGDILAGKYEVERVLGEGGMGIVVAAKHIQLQQLVALKFLLTEIAAKGTQAHERFLREARAAVRLKSEHVAKVMDVGTLEDGAPYVVMEYLEGLDLGDVLSQRGPFPTEAACDCIIQACEALAEAHSLGIIHRDLKPQNLFMAKGVGGTPKVKVLDFGIAKWESAETRLTRTGAVVGSPLYMSPEQMRSSRAADPRSDIWSLGIILYELLTGHVPFPAETITELCLMVAEQPPRPLSEHRPDVPQALQDAIYRCLDKSPDNRFQDVASLAAALAPYASSMSRSAADMSLVISGRASGPSQRSRKSAESMLSGERAGSGTVAATNGGMGPRGTAYAATGLEWSAANKAPSVPPKSGVKPWVVAVPAVLLGVGAVALGAMFLRPSSTPGAQGGGAGIASAPAPVTSPAPAAASVATSAPTASAPPADSTPAASASTPATPKAPPPKGPAPTKTGTATATTTAAPPPPKPPPAGTGDPPRVIE